MIRAVAAVGRRRAVAGGDRLGAAARYKLAGIVIREPEAAPAAGTGLAEGAAGCRAAHLADDGLPVTVVIED